MSVAKPRNAGLVDIIGAGYRALHRRPWVIGIPASLSAYLWLGPPLALGALLGQLQGDVRDLGRVLGGASADWEALALRVLASDSRVTLAWLNFVPVLAPSPVALSQQPASGGLPQLAAAMVLINLLALLVSSLFLTLLGQAVSGERARPGDCLLRALRVATDIVRYLLALAGVGLVLALPFLAISAIVIATLPAATVVVLLAWYVALFWAYVYTGFAPEAILISGVGPMRAIYNSFQVVRRDLAGTIGLLLLSFVIVSGLGVIWRQIAVTPAGLVLAILGSAYIGTGLSAARLEFYRERFARWAMAA